MAKVEKSTITIGFKNETTPKTKVAKITTDPMSSPSIIQFFPRLAELRGMESQIYEDHFYIIERFIGTL